MQITNKDISTQAHLLLMTGLFLVGGGGSGGACFFSELTRGPTSLYAGISCSLENQMMNMLMRRCK